MKKKKEKSKITAITPSIFQNIGPSIVFLKTEIINARFLLNEHGDLYFLFNHFSENSILNNWEKN